jgi:hypothetical protein
MAEFELHQAGQHMLHKWLIGAQGCNLLVSRPETPSSFLGRNILLKKKLRGFSPPATYTDRATAVCREVSANFSGKRVSRGQRNESPRPLISVF